MNITQALAQVVAGQHLSKDDMAAVMNDIMTGQCSDAQIGGFLVALRIKGETIDEIAAAVSVMRSLMTPVELPEDVVAVDTCGTGGDGSNLFNVSTAAAFVITAAGGYVAKHGNRSVSSASGSSDLLEQAGIFLELTPEQIARCVENVGVGFMFAPMHHAAVRHVMPARKSLGMRTLFNLLGPMTNPARVKRQVIGVFDKALCAPLAEVLNQLGSEHVLVVHSEDGLDEFSLAAPTHVAELKNGKVTEYSVTPEQVGLTTQAIDDLSVTSADESLALIKEALGKRTTPVAEKAAEVIALNAGAALYVAGIADTLKEGVARAEDAILTGLSGEKLRELAQFTQVYRG
ncbi:anthranilate phosphoribosyltransferase [Salinibius halmophilus]|uniref:anthranilate phosphoribosyltransferase n=1 Tax=Salinibius halmophilus TaxID=1853216 RepID=UPI000E660EB2|nr:anthranilate phosphoribosyltransferase [Salinibius halmophilus]